MIIHIGVAKLMMILVDSH